MVIYIGQSINNCENYYGSGKILKQAIKKYCKENFIKEIIIQTNDFQLLQYLEEFYINVFNSTDKNIGYNIKSGGYQSGKHSLETKIKIGIKSKNMSKESRKKVSDGNKGKKLSQETKNKIGKSSIGRKHSIETINKLREANLGNKNPQFGKPTS